MNTIYGHLFFRKYFGEGIFFIIETERKVKNNPPG